MGNSKIEGAIKNPNLIKEEEEKLKEKELSPKKFESILRSFRDIFTLLDKFIGIKTGKYGTLRNFEDRRNDEEAHIPRTDLGQPAEVPSKRQQGRSLTFKEKKIASDNTKYLEKFRYDTPEFYTRINPEMIKIIDDNISIINRIIFNTYRSRSGVNTPIHAQPGDHIPLPPRNPIGNPKTRE
jgi:hypothetical protein